MPSDNRDNTNPQASGSDFVTRWSRRKTVAERQAKSEHTAERSANPSPQQESGNEGGRLSGELTDDDMPPIESLDRSSDFSLFMAPGVSERLRRMALRKLFALPEFNIRDGLDDYDDDYRMVGQLSAQAASQIKQRLQRVVSRSDEDGADTQPDPARDEATPTRSGEPDRLTNQHRTQHQATATGGEDKPNETDT